MSPNVAIEIERKYIIRMPDLEVVRAQAEHTESNILQMYLPHERGETHRIRRREYADKVVCTETRKVRLDIIHAVSSYTGFSSDKITILKMEK